MSARAASLRRHERHIDEPKQEERLQGSCWLRRRICKTGYTGLIMLNAYKLSNLICAGFRPQQGCIKPAETHSCRAGRAVLAATACQPSLTHLSKWPKPGKTAFRPSSASRRPIRIQLGIPNSRDSGPRFLQPCARPSRGPPRSLTVVPLTLIPKQRPTFCR